MRSARLGAALLWAMVCVGWLLPDHAARAQDLPRQITIVVPFPPGASNDLFARLLAQKLAPRIGATIVVENKPGASGAIGAAFVSRAAPTGATLLLTSSTFPANAAVVGSALPFDPVEGLVPVAQLARGPMIIAVGADAPDKNLADLLKGAAVEKGKSLYGTAGIGSINHMASELLNVAARVEMVHVPYKGLAPATTDLIGGRIHMIIGSFPSLIAQIKGGKLRGLAVTSTAPSPFAPDLPAASATVPGYAVELWWGVFGPAGTSPTLAERLNADVRAIVTDAEMVERFAQEGATASTLTAAEFGAAFKADLDMWRRIATERNIKPE